MIVKLLTEHHLEFLSLKGGCIGWSKSTHVKMPHCWKSHALAQLKYVHTQVNNFVSSACVVYKARSTHMDVMTPASSSSRQRRRRRRQRRQNFI